MKNKVLRKIWGGLILLVSISIPLLIISLLAHGIYNGQWSWPTTSDLIKVSILFLFLLVASYFGVRSGLKRLVGEKEMVSVAHSVGEDVEVKVTTRLSLNDFIRLSLELLKENFSGKIGPWALFILFGLFVLISNFSNGASNVLLFLIPTIAILLIPVFSYKAIKKNYESSKTISEQIEYTITIDQIAQRGESFEATISWESIHKVIELKDWFVIYLSDAQVYGLQKKDFNKKEDIVGLREIILSKEALNKN